LRMWILSVLVMDWRGWVRYFASLLRRCCIAKNLHFYIHEGVGFLAIDMNLSCITGKYFKNTTLDTFMCTISSRNWYDVPRLGGPFFQYN
jgi:hypothetical protein